MVLLIPVYSMLQVKNLLKSYERFESIYEQWLKGLCKATLYPLIALILLLTGLAIGNRAGLYSHYAIGVPFTIITIAVLLLALYLTFLMFLSEHDCEPLTGTIHERDIKNFLNKLERPDVRTWLTVLIQPFILLWMNILIESTGSSDLSSLEKLVFLFVSGYIPLRLLTEFETPFTPVNLIMGLSAIVFFVFQIIGRWE
jgi:hypothetical protein